jgi:hypothetical protein
MADFDEAIDRLIAGLEKKRVMSRKEREIVAYHESGHAIVATALPGMDPVHKISIVQRGFGALGYTMQLPLEDRYLMQRRDLQHQLAVLLGGRTAEEIALGEISTGAQNDLQRATDIARAMVTEWGMSDLLGAINYNGHKRGKFLDVAAGPERGNVRGRDGSADRRRSEAHHGRGARTPARAADSLGTARQLETEVTRRTPRGGGDGGLAVDDHASAPSTRRRRVAGLWSAAGSTARGHFNHLSVPVQRHAVGLGDGDRRLLPTTQRRLLGNRRNHPRGHRRHAFDLECDHIRWLFLAQERLMIRRDGSVQTDCLPNVGLAHRERTGPGDDDRVVDGGRSTAWTRMGQRGLASPGRIRQEFLDLLVGPGREWLRLPDVRGASRTSRCPRGRAGLGAHEGHVGGVSWPRFAAGTMLTKSKRMSGCRVGLRELRATRRASWF